jgi:tetratricopeptide (TPR) repeat protein
MAWAYHRSGQADKAITAIEKTLELLTTDKSIAPGDARLRAGKIYEVAGMTQKALEADQRVLQLEPVNDTARDAIQRLGTDSQN